MSCGRKIVRVLITGPEGEQRNGWATTTTGLRMTPDINCPTSRDHKHHVAPEDLQDLEQLEEWLDAGA